MPELAPHQKASQSTQPVPVEIVTARLCLRARRANDAEALFPTMSDAAVMTWWSRAPFSSVEALRENFTSQGANWRAWAITRRGDDRAIGFVAASKGRRAGVSEIGYLLAREVHGNGFAREALRGLINCLFAEGQRRVFADCDPDNRQSIALLRHLGFQLEGRLRAEWHTHIGIRDSLIYGLLADEWWG